MFLRKNLGKKNIESVSKIDHWKYQWFPWCISIVCVIFEGFNVTLTQPFCHSILLSKLQIHWVIYANFFLFLELDVAQVLVLSFSLRHMWFRLKNDKRKNQPYLRCHSTLQGEDRRDKQEHRQIEPSDRRTCNSRNLDWIRSLNLEETSPNWPILQVCANQGE